MAGLVDVYRNSVQTWECDQMGHMNVQFYVDKATAALAVLGHHLGLEPQSRRPDGAQLVTLEHHVRFIREQRAGAPLQIGGGILDCDEQRLRAYLEMSDPISGAVGATFIAEAELQDGDGQPLALPLSLRERAAGLQVTLPEHGGPRGLAPAPPRPEPDLAGADVLGMLTTYIGAVTPQMCDAHGRLAARHYMGIISDSIPNLVAQTQGRSRADSRIGGAALEYRLVYRRAPRPGDLLTLRSGIKAIGSKAYQLCHWLFDLSSGEAVMTSEAVAVMFDLEARRAIVIPDDARTALTEHLIPGLSA
jgi:acyl-CoA thioester hydrolase